MLPQQLTTVRAIGDEDWPYWLPASKDGEEPSLEPGEHVLWRGRVRVREKQPSTWSFPDTTHLAVTDRRIVFMTREFDKGGGWVGFGVIGLTVATTANVVSKRRAAQRSAGKVAIGQVRHEWLAAVRLRQRKALIGGTDTYLDLVVNCVDRPHTLELWGGRMVGEDLARWFVKVIAHHRRSLDVRWSKDALTQLQRHERGEPDPSPDGNPESLWWIFPGDAEALITAAMQATQSGSLPASAADRPAMDEVRRKALAPCLGPAAPVPAVRKRMRIDAARKGETEDSTFSLTLQEAEVEGGPRLWPGALAAGREVLEEVGLTLRRVDVRGSAGSRTATFVVSKAPAED